MEVVCAFSCGLRSTLASYWFNSCSKPTRSGGYSAPVSSKMDSWDYVGDSITHQQRSHHDEPKVVGSMGDSSLEFAAGRSSIRTSSSVLYQRKRELYRPITRAAPETVSWVIFEIHEVRQRLHLLWGTLRGFPPTLRGSLASYCILAMNQLHQPSPQSRLVPDDDMMGWQVRVASTVCVYKES